MVDYKEEQTSENIGITKTSMLIGAVLGQV